MSGDRRWAIAAALLVSSAIGFEVGARLEDWVRYRTPMLSVHRSRDDLVVRDADGMHGRPGARFQKFVMNTLGFRGPEIRRDKPAGTVRVVAAGASETFGLHETPGREYPRQLEDSLAARLALGLCRGTRAEVVNAAFPGMTLPTVAQDIRLRLGRYRPDVIVYYPSPVQYLGERPPVAAVPDSGERSRRASWIRALHPRGVARGATALRVLVPRVVRRLVLERRLALLTRRQPPEWSFVRVPADRLVAFEHDLRRLVGDVRTLGALPVLVARAHALDVERASGPDLLLAWRQFYPRASGATILGFETAAREVVRRVAADSAAVSLDLVAALGSEPQAVFADFAHFTDLGAAVTGGALARVVADAVPGDCP